MVNGKPIEEPINFTDEDWARIRRALLTPTVGIPPGMSRAETIAYLDAAGKKDPQFQPPYKDQQ